MGTLLLLGWLAVTTGAFPDFPTLIEEAVIQGSLVKLEAIRTSIEKRAGTADSATCDNQYLLAYTSWRTAQALHQQPRSKKKRMRLLKGAQQWLEECLEQEPENAEAHALRGTVIGERISGMFKGIALGPKSAKALDRAQELAPDNPRVAVQRGIAHFFTPKSFGGGTEKAERELSRALELFVSEPEDQAWPDWGHVDALAWLGQVLARQGKVAEARSAYEQALSIQPEWRWVRDELLPALQERGD